MKAVQQQRISVPPEDKPSNVDDNRMTATAGPDGAVDAINPDRTKTITVVVKIETSRLV